MDENLKKVIENFKKGKRNYLTEFKDIYIKYLDRLCAVDVLDFYKKQLKDNTLDTWHLEFPFARFILNKLKKYNPEIRKLLAKKSGDIIL